MPTEDNVHPVVELLAARMESHPEEFRIYDNSTLAIGGRWETWISQIRPFMNGAEHEMLFSTAKEAFLQRVHEEVLDELMNGEERRAQERRERDLEMQRRMAQARAYSQQNTAASQLGGANGYSYNSTTTALPGTFHDVTTDTYSIGGYKLTQEQLQDNPGLVATIKKALGI